MSNPEKGPVQNLNSTEKIEFKELENAPLLHDRKAPNYVRQQEGPKHRMILELAVRGLQPVEIAERVGCTTNTVYEILRQPHFQQDLVNGIRKTCSADEKVAEIIKDNVAELVQGLVDIAKDKSAKASDRIAAAEAVINRRYGKPNTPINRGSEVDLNSLPDSALVEIAKGN